MYNPWSGRFTQKLLRYMRSNWIEQHSQYADKVQVRQLVEDRIGPGYLTELYAVADSFDDVDVDALPSKFYVKANHGCAFNVECLDKADFDVAATSRRMQEFLATDYYALAGERQYRLIKRKVLVEEYLDLTQPDCMVIRLWSFDGQVAFILVDTMSGREGPYDRGFYLPDWTPAPFFFGRPRAQAFVDRPDNLAEILEIGSLLSKGLPFVRVDLYWLAGRIVFSELTLTPRRGIQAVTPGRYDRELGTLFVLPRSRRG